MRKPTTLLEAFQINENKKTAHLNQSSPAEFIYALLDFSKQYKFPFVDANEIEVYEDRKIITGDFSLLIKENNVQFNAYISSLVENIKNITSRNITHQHIIELYTYTASKYFLS